MAFEPINPGEPIRASDENAKRAAINRLLKIERARSSVNDDGRGHGDKRRGRIVSSTATGIQDAQENDVQWTYQLWEVVKVRSGYSTDSQSAWEDLPLGMGWRGTAYNEREDGNTGTGRQNNGVDHDGTLYSESEISMQAAPDDTIVRFEVITVVEEDGTLVEEAWFDWHNAEDGECAE